LTSFFTDFKKSLKLNFDVFLKQV